MSVDEDVVESLRTRVNELEERLNELESGSDSSGSSSGGFGSGPGPRDKAVLNQLDRGEVVTVANLKQLYQMHTDIRTSSTLKNRVKSVTNRPEFDLVTPGKWRYTGGESDE